MILYYICMHVIIMMALMLSIKKSSCSSTCLTMPTALGNTLHLKTSNMKPSNWAGFVITGYHSSWFLLLVNAFSVDLDPVDRTTSISLAVVAIAVLSWGIDAFEYHLPTSSGNTSTLIKVNVCQMHSLSPCWDKSSRIFNPGILLLCTSWCCCFWAKLSALEIAYWLN